MRRTWDDAVGTRRCADRPRVEAAGALLRHSFATLDTHRVEAHIHPENAATQRQAVRLGFRQEALMRDGLFRR